MFSGSPIKRIGRNRFLRNVLIAIGNAKSKKSLPFIKRNLRDESSIVRGAAGWAIQQILKNKELKAVKKKVLAAEKDLDVRAEWNLDQ